MQVFEGPVDGRLALDEFLDNRVAAVPGDVRTQLRDLVRRISPVETCVNAAELIYARRDDLPPELLDIGAALAVMASSHGFSAGLDGRGARMALVLRGEDVADIPEPKAEFLPPTSAEANLA